MLKIEYIHIFRMFWFEISIQPSLLYRITVQVCLFVLLGEWGQVTFQHSLNFIAFGLSVNLSIGKLMVWCLGLV